MTKLETLQAALGAALGTLVQSTVCRLGEITVNINGADLPEVARRLRDDPSLQFDTLIDICGLDYQGYGDGERQGKRFASVCHLLSVSLNQRVTGTSAWSNSPLRGPEQCGRRHPRTGPPAGDDRYALSAAGKILAPKEKRPMP